MTGTVPLDWQASQREHLFFTWSQQRPGQGMEVLDAKGAKFRSGDGKWRWDLESQVYNVNVGHKHPHIVSRMKAQLDAIPACAPNALLPIRAELAQSLAQRSGMQRAFLTCGGSEAVENAIKMARLVTGRQKVITRRSSYHGATLSVLGIAGDRRKAPFEAHLPPGIHIEDPWPARAASAAAPSDWVESFESLLETHDPRSIAAVLLEGFTGTNGMQMPPADFWPRVRGLCDQHGILLICDEIFSGFGRTGRWFANEHWGVEPDMLTIGKGLTSGYAPLAGVLVSPDISAHFDNHELTCGLTHYAHPVSCAAAMGSIEVLARERLVENAAQMGERFQTNFNGLVERHGCVVEARGLGLMRALQFDKPVQSLCAKLWDAGVFAPSRDEMLWVCPPLCIDAAGVDEVCGILDAQIAGWA